MRAMILAAGRGQRMRPLTDRIPKPLLAAGGKPLIVHHIERLRAAGIEDLVVNVAWLGERIEAALGDGAELGVRIRYSREPAGALETAGGIRAALPLLGTAPFLVISGDVYVDLDLARFAREEPEGLAHLLMVPNPPHHPEGDFALVGGRLAASGGPRFTYAGIGLFRPRMFEPLPPGVRPLRPVLDAAVASGQVTAETHDGRWMDVGTPERLAALDEALGDERNAPG